MRQLVIQDTKGGLYNVAKRLASIYGEISSEICNSGVIITHYDRDLLRVVLKRLVYWKIEGVHFIHISPINFASKSKRRKSSLIFLLYKLADILGWKFIGISPEISAQWSGVVDIRLIYNPILDTLNKYPSAKNFEGGLRYVNMSRFEFQKNQLEGIRRFLNFRQENDILTLYGDGETLDECIEFVRVNQLESIVKFQPWSNSVRSELAKHDVYYQFSRYEGLPTIVVEAIDVGLVPITLPIASGMELFRCEHIITENFVLKRDDVLHYTPPNLSKFLIATSLNQHKEFRDENFTIGL